MRRAPSIHVIAGPNGAGKSSIAGATIRAAGADYFNPDEAAKRLLSQDPRLTSDQANAAAWNEGRRLLERAISEHLDYSFETTLGGDTIRHLLDTALDASSHVLVWYTGLATADLHIARVRARVKRGGHDIPEHAIRRRFVRGSLNLIHLLPRLTELRLYDNSAEADPHARGEPRPTLLLHVRQGRIRGPRDLTRTPDWAKPIVAAAIVLQVNRRR